MIAVEAIRRVDDAIGGDFDERLRSYAFVAGEYSGSSLALADLARAAEELLAARRQLAEKAGVVGFREWLEQERRHVRERIEIHQRDKNWYQRRLEGIHMALVLLDAFELMNRVDAHEGFDSMACESHSLGERRHGAASRRDRRYTARNSAQPQEEEPQQ